MKVVNIKIENIYPDENQPRKIFEDIGELASSILKEGLIEPLKVIKIKDRFVIMDGERRYRALKLLCDKDGEFERNVKCIIVPESRNRVITQLVTDIHKHKLSLLEEANVFKHLIEKEKFSINDIKMRIGKPREYITKRLKLLCFSPNTQKKIQEGKIKFTVACAMDVDTIKNKEDIIISRIEEENADISRAKEIIYEENYKYEGRINCFISEVDRFLNTLDKFNTSIKVDINMANVLKPIGLKIKQAFQDIDKLEFNLNKIDNVKEKVKEVKKKLEFLFQKFSNQHTIVKEDFA